MHTEGKNDSNNELADFALHVVNLEQQCQATRIRVWRKAYHLVSLPAWWYAFANRYLLFSEDEMPRT
uniref:Uncharacterized protein n=1 Tax=Oryza meridionalis TaxID=40149 RepID=A0A0E0F0W3_9ORYZ